jgi:phage terminase small subunit
MAKTPPANEPRPDAAARRRRFVDEYLIDLNGVRAYLAAFGRTVRGRPRSYHSACVESSKLLQTPAVRREVRAAQASLRARCVQDAERVVRELAAIAFGDIGDILDYTNAGPPLLKPAREVPAVARKALKSMKATVRVLPDGEGRVEEWEIVMHNKLAALDKLARHLGLLRDEVPIAELLRRLSPGLRRLVAAELGIEPTEPSKE